MLKSTQQVNFESRFEPRFSSFRSLTHTHQALYWGRGWKLTPLPHAQEVRQKLSRYGWKKTGLGVVSPEPELWDEFSSHLDIGLFLENEEDHCIF